MLCNQNLKNLVFQKPYGIYPSHSLNNKNAIFFSQVIQVIHTFKMKENKLSKKDMTVEYIKDIKIFFGV